MSDPPTSQASSTGPSRSSPSRSGPFVLLAVLVILATLPLWADDGLLRNLTELLTYLALAQTWNLLAGYTGLVSIGQQAWIGVGGYAFFILTDDLGLSIWLALPLTAVVAALMALPASALLFRLRAGYFSLGTWVLAEVFRLVALNDQNLLRGSSGRSLNMAMSLEPAYRIRLTYILALGLATALVAGFYLLMRSRTGLGLAALRDSESAAASLGVRTRGLKLSVYVLSAACTALVGAVIYFSSLRITPDAAFTVNWTAYALFIVIIGGIGTLEGPIIGAVLFFLIRQVFSELGEWALIILGSITIAMMVFAPKGLWGVLQRRTGLSLLPLGHHLHDAQPDAQPDVTRGESK
jgi:branched-chain amino acid transport system permease protein